jgi:hypothetical protein
VNNSRFNALIFGMLSAPKKQSTHAGFTQAFIVV